MVVLPQPDSPTKPKLSPRSTVNDTPDTALTQALGRVSIPPPSGKCLTRSVTRSSGASGIRPPPFRELLQPAARLLARTDPEKVRGLFAAAFKGMAAALGEFASGNRFGDRRYDAGDFNESAGLTRCRPHPDAEWIAADPGCRGERGARKAPPRAPLRSPGRHTSRSPARPSGRRPPDCG